MHRTDRGVEASCVEREGNSSLAAQLCGWNKEFCDDRRISTYLLACIKYDLSNMPNVRLYIQTSYRQHIWTDRLLWVALSYLKKRRRLRRAILSRSKTDCRNMLAESAVMHSNISGQHVAYKLNWFVEVILQANLIWILNKKVFTIIKWLSLYIIFASDFRATKQISMGTLTLKYFCFVEIKT